MSEIRTENLIAGYNKKPVISDVCLEIKPGKIAILIGPNGSGKSTVLKTVAGMLEPVGGAVYIDEKKISEMTPVQKAGKMSVMMTQRSHAEYATCFEVVSVGRYRFTGLLGTLKPEDNLAIENAMKSTGAYELKDLDFDRISDGQKQKVLLARALVQDPRVMILDEPTSFLDIGYKLEFLDNLRRIVRERSISVLMSMHELELAERIADTVICISSSGAIDAIGSPEKIFTGKYIESLFGIRTGGLSSVYSFASRSMPTARKTSSLKLESGTRFIMVQGTMSSAGKSLIAAGLCRIFKQDGYSVAPFKSQNMALNSYITEDGLEMGRAQVLQAEAAGVNPSVYMNPILLKPTSDCGSQVIVNGRVIGNMRAREYFEYKTALIPDILKAVEKLSETADIIVIEGAGSPAEINLKHNDIVNMGMAAMVNAPVLLVGDIDRGGVFAQLLGTVELLEEDEKKRIGGLIVNKFRGDKTILDPGIEMLEERSGIPVVGVIPYMNLKLDDEDSLTERFEKKHVAAVNLGVIHLPHISNFTDFNVFEQIDGLAVNYIDKPSDIEMSDAVIIPGSKNTISDMKWLRETGLESAIKKFSAAGNVVIGICGGYQMLGIKIADPEGVEAGGEITGLELLPVVTVLEKEKHRRQVSGTFTHPDGCLKQLKGTVYTGYEIHMGVTTPVNSNIREFTSDCSGYCTGNTYGSYVHGLFDNHDVVKTIVQLIASSKGVDLDTAGILDARSLKERELNRLAATMREYMDMDLIYKMLGVDRGE